MFLPSYFICNQISLNRSFEWSQLVLHHNHKFDRKNPVSTYAEIFFEYDLLILWTLLQVQAEKLVRADSKS
jgi:hypothetical protein